MAWLLVRATTDLVDDPPWRGQVVGDPSGPAASLFVPIGVPNTGAYLSPDGKVNVRLGWLDGSDDPVAIAGSATLEPMTSDVLPSPTVGQTMNVASIGEASAATATAWVPLNLEIGRGSQVSFRLSSMTAAGATRAAVWVWSKDG